MYIFPGVIVSLHVHFYQISFEFLYVKELPVSPKITMFSVKCLGFILNTDAKCSYNSSILKHHDFHPG